MASTPGQLVGRLRVKVIPDTSDFADELRDDLRAIRRRIGDLKIKVKGDLDSASFRDIDRRIKRIIQDKTVNVRGRFLGFGGGSGGGGGILTNPVALLAIVVGIGSLITPALGAIVLAIGLLAGLVPPILALAIGAEGIANAFGNMTGPLTKIKDELTGIIGDVVRPFVETLSRDDVGGTIFDGLVKAAESLRPIIAAINDELIKATENGQLARIFDGIEPVMAAIAPLVGLLLGWFIDLVDFALPFVAPFLREITKALQNSEGDWKSIAPLVGLGVEQFTALAVVLIENLPKAVIALVIAGQVMQGILFGVSSVFMTVGRTIGTIIQTFRNDWDKLGEAYRVGGEGIMGALSVVAVFFTITARAILNGVAELVSGIINAGAVIVETITDATQHFTDIGTSWPEAMRNASDLVRRVIRNLASDLPDMIGNANAAMVDAGTRIVQSVANGIRRAFHYVQSALGDLTSLIPDWKGPEQRDRHLLDGPADVIMGSFAERVRSNFGVVKSAFNDVPISIDGALSAGAGGGVTQVFQVDPTSQRGYVEEVASAAARGTNRILALRQGRTT